ncbi:hypothetical protein ABBQ38_011249 [Trebouxia sp. C0009 RCD-2024]
MQSDEEAARRLHLEINGGRRRYLKRSQDQGVASPAEGKTTNCPPHIAQGMGVHVNVKSEKPGETAGQTTSWLAQNDHMADVKPCPSLQPNTSPVNNKPAAVVIKVPLSHPCYAKAAALREKAEKSSSTQCFYTKVAEPRRVSSPYLIDSRTKLAMFVNSMFSCEKIKCGQGAMLDVVFVPRDRGAASIRFPPLPPQQTWEGPIEERSPDGTTWSSASRNAAFVMLTQNEGTMKNMRHPKLVH